MIHACLYHQSTVCTKNNSNMLHACLYHQSTVCTKLVICYMLVCITRAQCVPRLLVSNMLHACLYHQSTVCSKIMDQLGQNLLPDRRDMVTIINQDSFYRDLTPDEHKRAMKGEYNFDHPGWWYELQELQLDLPRTAKCNHRERWLLWGASLRSSSKLLLQIFAGIFTLGASIFKYPYKVS